MGGANYDYYSEIEAFEKTSPLEWLIICFLVLVAVPFLSWYVAKDLLGKWKKK